MPVIGFITQFLPTNEYSLTEFRRSGCIMRRINENNEKILKGKKLLVVIS